MFKLAILGISLLLGALQLPMWGQAGTLPKELVQYVQDAKNAGLKEAEIQRNAIAAGWGEQDVKSALDSQFPGSAKIAPTQAVKAPAQPALAQPPNNSSPAPLTPAKTMPTEKATAATDISNTGVKSEPALPGKLPANDAGSPKPNAVNRGVPDEYRIGEGDVLQVNVWGEPTASVSSVVVRPDGKITMPLIKDISVAGLTPAEAEGGITEQLSKQIRAADVTVIVNQINSKKIFVVGGGIKKEGPINFTYRMTVMQALSEAGGLTDYAKRKKIYVLRNENGRQYQLKFDYDAVLKGEHMETNIPLIAGDTLVVPNH